MQEAFDHLKTSTDRQQLKKDIIHALLSEGTKQNFEATKGEVEMFANRVYNLLHAETRKLSGNKHQLKHDFRMKRLALAHFLEHGKTGHNRLRESSL